MTTAYTSLLGLALPVTGELSGTWGDTVNDSITSLLDTSVAGTTNVSTDGDVTLTTTTGAANTARQAILLFSGARTALRTVTAPAQSKIYTVINATTGGFSVKLVGAGPTTGLTIPNGASAVVAWNGSDFVEVGAGSIGNLIVNGTLTVTGATTLQSTLAVTGNITNTAGTANGVTYLNGSKVLTSGSALAFDGTNALTLFRTTATEANEPTIRFSNLTFAGQNPGVVKSSNGGLALDIQSPSDSTFQLRSRLYMSGGSGNNISFQASSDNGSTYSERMVLTSTGLGIGTSSPAYKLDVAGTVGVSGIVTSTVTGGQVVKAESGTTGILYSNFANTGGTFLYGIDNSTGTAIFSGSSAYAGFIGTTGARSLVLATNSVVRATIDSSGNLGLGVTPSASSLSGFIEGAYGNIGFTSSLGVSIAGNAYYNSGWKYKASSTATLQLQDSGGIKWNVAASGTAGNAITFTQAMTLTAAGNLGIGITSPTFQLSLSSNATFWESGLKTVITGGNQELQIRSEAPGGGGRTGSIGMYTNNSLRATLDSSGNLGLGVTPSAWGLGKALQIAGSTGFLGFSETNGNIVTNGYYDGSNYRYINSAHATMTTQSGGAHAWFTAPTGTAGNAITFTQAMTLSAGGQWSVGVTSAVSVAGVAAAHSLATPSNNAWITSFICSAPTTPWGIALNYSATAPNNSTSSYIYCYDTALRMAVQSNGGIHNYQANDVNLSDRREKTNFAPAKSYLDVICAIPVQTFNYIDQNLEEDNGLTLGVVAQDVQAVAPELVMESNWGTKDEPKMRLSIYQTDLQYALMKCIQEQQAIIESLKARLDAANL